LVPGFPFEVVAFPLFFFAAPNPRAGQDPRFVILAPQAFFPNGFHALTAFEGIFWVRAWVCLLAPGFPALSWPPLVIDTPPAFSNSSARYLTWVSPHRKLLLFPRFRLRASGWFFSIHLFFAPVSHMMNRISSTPECCAERFERFLCHCLRSRPTPFPLCFVGVGFSRCERVKSPPASLDFPSQFVLRRVFFCDIGPFPTLLFPNVVFPFLPPSLRASLSVAGARRCRPSSLPNFFRCFSFDFVFRPQIILPSSLRVLVALVFFPFC